MNRYLIENMCINEETLCFSEWEFRYKSPNLYDRTYFFNDGLHIVVYSLHKDVSTSRPTGFQPDSVNPRLTQVASLASRHEQ